jgi:hypothetical protein
MHIMNQSEKSVAVPDEIVMRKIYVIRNLNIMLDRDLAELFEVKPIRLREQVKRNIEKFPPHFMFQLTNSETEWMVSQNAIPSRQHLGGTLPYVFTEYGVLQLANVLRSGKAVQVSIKIIEVFVKMREYLSSQHELYHKIEELERKGLEHDEKLVLIFQYLKQLEQVKQEEQEFRNRKSIGFRQAGKE